MKLYLSSLLLSLLSCLGIIAFAEQTDLSAGAHAVQQALVDIDGTNLYTLSAQFAASH